MHEMSISVPDEVFIVLSQKAKIDGFESTEQYVRDFILSGHEASPENFDHLFTPKVIEYLDEISARIEAGEKTYTVQEAKEYLAQSRSRWLENHKS